MYTVPMSYHRIYIAKLVEREFKEEDNKSGLVNKLLLKHYIEAEIPTDKMMGKIIKTADDVAKVIPKSEVTSAKTCVHGARKGECLQKAKVCKNSRWAK